MIFGDAVLRELARVRPSTPERMRRISGVGDVKLRDFAGRFLPVLTAHCREHGLETDVTARPSAPAPPRRTRPADQLPRAARPRLTCFVKMSLLRMS